MRISLLNRFWHKFCLMVGLCFVLAGCMNNQERLVVNADGTGTLEQHEPSYMPAFAVLLGGNSSSAPLSTEEIAVLEKNLIEQFSRYDVKATVVTCKVTSADGWTSKDVVTKMDSVSLFFKPDKKAPIEVFSDDKGDWLLRVGQGCAREELSRILKPLASLEKIPAFAALSAKEQEKVRVSFQQYKTEFLVTFPKKIVKLGGVFEKVDDNTAKATVAINLLDSKAVEEALKKVEASFIATSEEIAKKPVTEVKGAQDGRVALSSGASSASVSGDEGAKAASGTVRVFLKGGKVVVGRLLERQNGSVKVDFDGVPVIFYNDEIEKIE